MKEHWQDLIVLAFGVWLLCSPWWLEYFTGYPYTDQSAPSWHSIFFGLAITIFAIGVLVLPEKPRCACTATKVQVLYFV